MKKYLLLVFFGLILFNFESTAQNQNEPWKLRSIGITFSSFGWNEVIELPTLNSSEGVTEVNHISFGLVYLHSLKNNTLLDAGLEYSQHKIQVRWINVPDKSGTTSKDFVRIINIPLSLRYLFYKYLFVNGGFNFSFDFSRSGLINRQSGIGVQGGLGGQYDFKNGITVFLNPYLKTYTILAFYQGNDHQSLIESGFRFGISYNLMKDRKNTNPTNSR